MKLMRISLIPAALAVLASAPVLAALGGSLDSVQGDMVRLKGAVRVTANAGYTVHEISTGYGMTLREFAGSDGKVFAVAWSGPVYPDLQQVLGSYYSQFAQATPVVHSHRRLSVEQPGLVVENNGRLRAFSGRAWVPSMLPANFPVDAIR